jgi:hypothetical protein
MASGPHLELDGHHRLDELQVGRRERGAPVGELSGAEAAVLLLGVCRRARGGGWAGGGLGERQGRRGWCAHHGRAGVCTQARGRRHGAGRGWQPPNSSPWPRAGLAAAAGGCQLPRPGSPSSCSPPLLRTSLRADSTCTAGRQLVSGYDGLGRPPRAPVRAGRPERGSHAGGWASASVAPGSSMLMARLCSPFPCHLELPPCDAGPAWGGGWWRWGG